MNDSTLKSLEYIKDEMKYVNECSASSQLHRSLEKWILDIESILEVNQPKCITCGAPISEDGCFKKE